LGFKSVIEDVAVKLLQLSVTELPLDVKDALQRAYLEEESESGKTQLRTILKNLEAAKNKRVPICQDTGIIIFNIEVGSEFRGLGEIEKALSKATVRATKEIPLRPNAVNPFTQKNTGNNTGRNIPFIYWRIVPGSGLNLTVMPKGGGSENVCTLGMLNPGSGVKALKRFVIDTIINAGAKPCPPTIVGVGVGGGADIATKLAKAALLKPLNQPNPDPKLGKLENKLLEAANSTGIGPMGLGGKITVLGVKLDYSYRHPASYPVAVAFQCWAARRASAYIDSDCKVKYLSHNVIS
jgi:fumarate hydratase subunit alpha